MTGLDIGTTFAVAVIVFVAFVVRGMSGFGTALVAIPLLAYVLPIHTAVPLMGALGLVVMTLVGVRDRAWVAWDELRRLALPTVVGVGSGVWFFSQLDARVMLKLLGAFIVCYALYMVASEFLRQAVAKCSPHWAAPAGFTGSFIDSMFGGGGGVVAVIYMHRRGHGKIEFRSTLAVLWLGELILRVGGYAIGGYYTGEVMMLCLLMLPVMYAGTRLGERIANAMSPRAFSRVLAALLLASGGSLLFR